MIIREFKDDDVDNGLLETYSEVWMVDIITKNDIMEWKNNNNYMFVVEHSGEIIGSCTIHFQKKLIRNGSTAAYIEEVVVREKYRGQKIGEQLINRAVEFAKSKSVYKIVLSCFPNRVDFYERCGFYNESILMRYKVI
jgi:GNAT superfamily N-acetyltransferase